ncbi:MAG: 3-oxoacyl-ACP synthase [Chlamydiales bacterium]|jgi:3-oxoacyl-[acyl-carrier-protein] synthase-1|nr:3-oxoacyl-ACP synthase [Chlamydiales bacterium]
MTNFYLNDMGIACSLGKSKGHVVHSLFKAKPFVPNYKTHTLISGRIVPEITLPFDLPELPTSFCELNSKNNRLLRITLDEIAESVSTAKDLFGANRIGVVLGTSSSGMAEGESAYLHRIKAGYWPNGYSYSQQEIANPSLFASHYFGLQGPAYTISTACSSGAKALCAASRLLEAGICDAVVTGGADTMCDLIRNGFDSLELLSETICNPFSKNRRGITLGEGSAVFLMTREKLSNSSSIILKGYGESSDACHISAPEPNGRGAEDAIRQALQMAKLSVEEIAYINLHGTGSYLNDSMESICIDRIFGPQIPCSSTKGITGHTLGAAGAIEAAFLWLCLQQEQFGYTSLPNHIWDHVFDPQVPCIKLIENNEKASHINGCIHMMSNSFAFGGSNVSLILSKTVSL